MSWLEIRWDESGSVFDDLDRILEGLSTARTPRKLGADVVETSEDIEDEPPGYAWFNHPTLPHAKVWSPIPFLPEGPIVSHSREGRETTEDDATP